MEIEESAEEVCAQAQRLLDRGEPLLAFNALQGGLDRFPGHARLRQLQALALARSGDLGRANALLAALAAEGHDDAETLGLLARTHKDLALRSSDTARRASHLAAGFELYERAFGAANAKGASADAWYTGINAAAMAAFAGDLARARRIAQEVRMACARDGAAADAGASAYWREATLGEAALILGDAQAAARHYESARALAGRRYGDLGTTRLQARRLAAHLPPADADATGALAIPPVLAFTGHMIDPPGRDGARFPAGLEPAVREALRARIAAIAPLAAYGSAACGADILCLELAREVGAETHVVLPFPPAEFRRSSVDFAQGDWAGRFERALAAADSVTVASDHRASGSTATFEYANLILTGLATLRGQMLDTPVRAVAAWDRGAPGAAGGAASVVSLWEARGLAIDHVGLETLRGAAAPAPAPAAKTPEASAAGIRHELRAMLFADAVGYSRMSEDQIPRYISGFLGAVAALAKRTAHPFEHAETAGDGLYMVFPGVADAGHFALELKDLVEGFDRAACGLPADFDLRIALHCGPVHCGRDPITGSRLYTGPHTSRTARIEPITPPGQVYASSAFAAVAAASGAAGLAMGYIGRIPLAKGYGTLGLYHVRRDG
ncbi:MAG: tetratricopeptide repeat-containing protein [Burkholderiales bacterium]